MSLPLDPAALTALVRPLATARYGADYDWKSIEWALARFTADYGLNLAPDFQRGHVWSRAQQEAFIENVLRGVIPASGLVIQFNCPRWESDYDGDLPAEIQIVDGLQRLTAVREFMAGRICAFGLSVDDFAGSPFDAKRRSQFHLRFAVHNFAYRAQLLQHYLDINAGGTPHASDEIDRVRALLASATGLAP